MSKSILYITDLNLENRIIMKNGTVLYLSDQDDNKNQIRGVNIEFISKPDYEEIDNNE